MGEDSVAGERNLGEVCVSATERVCGCCWTPNNPTLLVRMGVGLSENGPREVMGKLTGS